MNNRERYTDYDEETTERCERALVTLLGDVGPWNKRVYLVGGLAPKYLIGDLPEGARAHVGTTDVDLVLGIALGDDTPETYRTLKNNLEKSGFRQVEPSFRWAREVDGAAVLVEFLCETSEVDSGDIFRPKGEGAGSGFAAFNVRGALLVREDYVDVQISGDRLDGGGNSQVRVRVANLTPFFVLKIMAFQDRHENKDAYDLVFTLLNYESGPRAAGRVASTSPVIGHPVVREAIGLLADRFSDIGQDGPIAYAAFLSTDEDDDQAARLKQEAVATTREFLAGLG